MVTTAAPVVDDDKPLLPLALGANTRRYLYATARILCVSALSVVVLAVALFGFGQRSEAPAPAFASKTIIGGGVFGSCANPPSTFSTPLRWNSDPSTADHICCHNERFAEYSGYWQSTTFPTSLPAGTTEITFYDAATGRPLFIAPRGRSYNDFYQESVHHGWPSFRDEEVVWKNVLVRPGGETVSVNGTHLGHNLPDGRNRYCINLVCVAGHKQAAR